MSEKFNECAKILEDIPLTKMPEELQEFIELQEKLIELQEKFDKKISSLDELSGVSSDIGIVVEDSREEKIMIEEMTGHGGYGNAVLNQYLERYGEELDEATKEFLKNVRVLDEMDLIALRKKGYDLMVKEDPDIRYYWPDLMPRLFLKMVHMFGHPTIRSTDGEKTVFDYFFKYKDHIINVRDKRGAIFFVHMTPHPVGKEDTPPKRKQRRS
ncbi:MAG: hypothetical protein DRN92_04415 [Thermoproteota archaeon]|nr:MAG: hypothetical protein DRN92_04415 [Candidatus Korarchaeota archaeon]